MEVEDDFPFQLGDFEVPILQGLNLDVRAFDDFDDFQDVDWFWLIDGLARWFLLLMNRIDNL